MPIVTTSERALDRWVKPSKIWQNRAVFNFEDCSTDMMKLRDLLIWAASAFALHHSSCAAPAAKLAEGVAGIKGIEIGMSVRSAAFTQLFDCGEIKMAPPEVREKYPELAKVMGGGMCKLKPTKFETVAQAQVRNWSVMANGDGEVELMEVLVPASDYESVAGAFRARYGKEARRAVRGEGAEVLDWLFQRGTIRLMQRGTSPGTAAILLSDGHAPPIDPPPSTRAKDL